MIETSILLVVKNAGPILDEVLKAVCSQKASFDYEVIAVDSGSTDQTLDTLRQYPVRVCQIPPQEFNHGDTRNFAAQQADLNSKYLVFLTQDATPADENWLDNLIKPMRDDPQVAGTFSRHLPRPNSTPSMVRQLTTSWQTGGSERLVKQKPENPQEYQDARFYLIYFSDTSSALRRSIWQKIPYRRTSFAEDMLWAEDVILGGYKLVFEPSSMVVHSHDYSLMEQFRQNVDHTNAMRELFSPPGYTELRTWWRTFRGIPRHVWRDWYFTDHSPFFNGRPIRQKLFYKWYSPWWHFSSGLGGFIGAYLYKFPPALKVFFSRQERIRSQQP